jgi:hydrogenase nickel incorporation protein HypA/HybF
VNDVHELSVALSLVDAVCEKAGALGNVRVDAVFVRLGELSGVLKDALSFCFEVAAKGTAVEGARLEVEDVPVTVLCPRCSAERRLASVQHLRCPVCDEPTPDVIDGRELELAALEVSDRAPHC